MYDCVPMVGGRVVGVGGEGGGGWREVGGEGDIVFLKPNKNVI